VLEPIRGRSDKCDRPCARESGLICKSFERLGLGNFGAALKDPAHMRPIQSIHRKTAKVIYKGQVKRTMLPSRDDHRPKITARERRKYIGKHSFVNRTMKLPNQLPAEALAASLCKSYIFRKRVRKVIISEK